MGSVTGGVRGHNVHMSEKDVAIVLSGGGVNGVLLELGFLKRLRRSSLWPRIACVYGTSAGALAGTMAALDRLVAAFGRDRPTLTVLVPAMSLAINEIARRRLDVWYVLSEGHRSGGSGRCSVAPLVRE